MYSTCKFYLFVVFLFIYFCFFIYSFLFLLFLCLIIFIIFFMLILCNYSIHEMYYIMHALDEEYIAYIHVVYIYNTRVIYIYIYILHVCCYTLLYYNKRYFFSDEIGDFIRHISRQKKLR